MTKIPDRTIERLITYRRLLQKQAVEGVISIYSHDLATLAHVKPVQVRRDLMEIGFSGSPSKGYGVQGLLDYISGILDMPGGTKAALVGAGNLGRALLSYFNGRSSTINVVAAFDVDTNIIGRVIAGCRCYDIQELGARAKEFGITIGIVTVPATQAQSAADALVEAGVTGILNFAPVPLRIRPDVYIVQVDITRALEKVAHFAKPQSAKEV